MPERCCRFPSAPLAVTFADLGMSPPSNPDLTPEPLNHMERLYPPNACVRGRRKLVQREGFESPAEIVTGYGAAAKGNTLPNYCGVRADMVDYVVDQNPCKQGRFTPGTHVPIHGPERLAQTRPDYVMILPWNLRDEMVEQMRQVRDWGGRFVVAIPNLEVLP